MQRDSVSSLPTPFSSSNHVLDKSPNQSPVSHLLNYQFDSNATISHHIMIVLADAGDKTADEEVVIVNVNGNASSWIDDRFDFDPEECNVANGKWVFNSSVTPLYSDISCPYIDRQFSCVKNGRNDSDYRHWEWQPEDCTLPR